MKQGAISGIYVIFGKDNRVYIGESGNILHRPTVDLAHRLGLSWTIVCYLPDANQSERHIVESAIHAAYEKAGYNVTSIDHQEVIRRAHRHIDFETRAQTLRNYWDTNPDARRKQAERIRAINARLTPEDRSRASKKGWETRRKNPGTYPSKRTLSRRRNRARRVKS